jgi:class 3 adenylate cyclase
MNAYVKALENFERNLIQYEKEGTQERMATNLNAIAFIYNKLGDDKSAQVYTKRSFEMAEEMENKPIMAAVLNNMGNIYMKRGDLQMAEEQFVSALKLGEEIGNKHLVGEGLYKLAQLSSEQGDNEKSLYYLDRASEIFEAIGTKDLSASSAIFRGGIFLEQGQYNQAADWCKNGLMLSEKLHSIAIERDACDCLYKTYKSLQQKSNALEYHERFLSLTDSLHLDHAGKRLQQMEFDGQMRTDSLVRAEELLDVQLVHDIDLGSKNRTRNVLIGSGILFLFLSGSLWSRLRLTRKSQARIQKEKDHSDDLLLHILPSEVVEELKQDGQALARESDLVSVLFTEFNGFNVPSDKDNKEESADELDYCMDGFDAIIQKHGMKKIKSNDNSYVAAGGPPMEKDAAVINTVRAALEMQEFITKRKTEQSGFSLPLPDVRIGIHSGLVVAGIIGIKNYKQDIWGETVNIASLVEINGEVGHVNISQHTYDLIKNDSDFTFENRGKIHAKGKGEMEMYFVFNSVTKK